MKKKHVLFLLALAAAIILSLTSCGGGDDAQNRHYNDTAVQVTEVPKFPPVAQPSQKNTASNLKVLKPDAIIHGPGENRIFIGSFHNGSKVADFSIPGIEEGLRRIFYFNPRKTIYSEGIEKGINQEIPAINKNGKTPFFRVLGAEKLVGIDTRSDFLKEIGVSNNEDAIKYANKVIAVRDRITPLVIKYLEAEKKVTQIMPLNQEQVNELQEFKKFWSANAQMEKSITLQVPDSAVVMLGGAELQASLPEGMKLQVNVDFTQFVEESVHATQEELLIAACLTALICFLFLGTFSSGFNIVLSIPTSVIGTFTILYFSGFTLNTFTLLALALAIGIVVDDSIMVLENVVRHFQQGKDRFHAALDGAREVTFAATAASVAVIAIFLPVAFMEGVIGRFFYQFGITVTAAVALSLLEAITLTPMRLSQMMVRRATPGWLERVATRVFDGLGRAYRRTLEIGLRFRWAVVIASLALFVSSLLLAEKLRREFVPSQDQNFIRMAIQLPVGSSVDV